MLQKQNHIMQGGVLSTVDLSFEGHVFFVFLLVDGSPRKLPESSELFNGLI